MPSLPQRPPRPPQMPTEQKPAPKPEKAMIVCLDDTSKKLEFKFNPTQIKFSKSTTWNNGQGQGRNKPPKRNVPTSEFQGGNAHSLSMDLMFDTTDDGSDVRYYTDFLVSLTLINPNAKPKPDPRNRQRDSSRPSLVKFIWGNFSRDESKLTKREQSQARKSTRSLLSFTAYVKDVNVTFSMFLPDGTPVRAETQVTFTAFEDEGELPFQNPTSRSEPREMHRVRAGETLDYIAYQHYGDVMHWRHLAQVNGLINPKDLQAGSILKITALPV